MKATLLGVEVKGADKNGPQEAILVAWGKM